MGTVLTKEAVTAKARALAKGLAEFGVNIKHAQAMELIARVEGETSWAVLKTKLTPTAEPADQPPKAALPAPGWRLVGSENLLPGHVLVDELPISQFGGTRKDALYDAMRVCGLPDIGWDPVISYAQRFCAFSAPQERPVLGAGEDRYADDETPCNRLGQTRKQVITEALAQVEQHLHFDLDAVLEEFVARNGLVKPFKVA